MIAAGGGATIKIGHVDSFSGVYAAASASQQHGMEVAAAEVMRKNNRIKYEILKGDDAAKPATGTTEAKRLMSQEKVDLLTGCLSSASVSPSPRPRRREQHALFLAVGTHDTNITGPKAHRVTFRQTCSNAMLANAVGPACSSTARSGISSWRTTRSEPTRTTASRRSCSRTAAKTVGEDLHPLGQTDYSSYLTKARNSDANVFVFCNYGPDTQNATKAAVQLGIKRRCCSAASCAVTTWRSACLSTTWSARCGATSGARKRAATASQVYNALKPGVKRGRLAPIPRLHGNQEHRRTGSTRPGRPTTEKLVEAFEDYHYDAAKKSGAYFRKCDHQAIQQTYVGVIVASNNKRRVPTSTS